MSDSDDDYDPAEVTVTVSTSAPPAAPAAASSGAPLSRADLFATSPATGVAVGHSSAPTSTPATPHADSADGGYRLRSDIKGRVRCLALNPAGTTLCAGSEDGHLCMWDFNVPLKSHRIAPTRVLTPFVNRISGLQPIIALAFAKDGSYVVACQDGDSPALVRASGEQQGYCAMGERGLMDVVQCRGHRAPVTCVAAHHADAAAFFTGSQDGTVRLWNHSTYKQRSVYAVKHGSGQVTDTHVVESVASLKHFRSGHGDVFASGGEDGFVQLWDARVKYRPGGALASVNLFAPSANADNGAFVEKHVGGMLEVLAGASTSSVAHDCALAVRVGSVIKTIDLRKLSSSSASSTAVRGGGDAAAAAVVVSEVAQDLPNVLDTTCLTAGGASGSPSLLTCTSRKGYGGVLGGHVVRFAFAAGASSPLERSMVWRAGQADEDVLCVCADRSRADGSVYAGLSSGEVVVHGAFSNGKDLQPVEAWLQTRPERENYGGRVVGEKAPRSVDDADVMADLF